MEVHEFAISEGMGSCPDGGRVVDGGARHVGRVAVFAGVGGYPLARALTDRFIPAMGVSAALALVNGAVGVVVAPRGRLLMVLGFTISGEKTFEIDAIADPARLRQLDLTVLDN
jgi:hypothetical protein